MRKHKFRVFAPLAVSALLISFAPAELHASEYRYEYSQAAGDIIGNVLDLVMEDYAGDEVSLEELYNAALHGIASELDIYSEYMDADQLKEFTDENSGELLGIGVSIRLNEDGLPQVTRTVKDSPASEAGVLRGDVIISVNGQSTEDKALDETTGIILDPAVKTAKIEILRGKEELNFEIEKAEIESLTVYIETLENILGTTGGKDIGYINMSSFSGNTGEDLEAAIEDLRKQGFKKMILDLRGNTGGHLATAEEVCSLLVPEGDTYTMVDNYGNEETGTSDLKTLPFDEIAILVDGYTASAAELFTAAMQDAEAAVVIGQTTFGKGVVQSLFPLPTGGAFKMTTNEYFRRSGETVNGVGVTPDYTVETNFYDYETPEDEMLLKAIEVLEAE